MSKHCGKAIFASKPNAEFCFTQCNNQQNVYNITAKKTEKYNKPNRKFDFMNNSSIIMYTTKDGLTKIETTFDENTVCL